MARVLVCGQRGRLRGRRAPTPVVGHESYRRLAHDVGRNGVTVIADLSGDLLAAALSGGVDLLKVSDDQLRKDGYCRATNAATCCAPSPRCSGRGQRTSSCPAAEP